ncbi:response regulator transcription factor [Clostridium sp. SHJSY1]|uniref:response regulator transcription factor n=1 Tax=Clostridium sp. SHJSY1 TaxID=2942483 RepID=UPI0028751DA4|nr:response regulator transcription factor [Clostridium sp. SHJSY1]MDS0528146.1 response regulator transcription factor [Clostridium sp. SHJSY1]
MRSRILVVEDDLKMQELIVEFLLSQDYDVDAASDGMEGYEYYRNNNYDLVILDILMPKLDGYGLCKIIRKDNEEVGIIFVTELINEEDEIKGFNLGGDDYVKKPFSLNILIKRIEAVLKRKKQLRSFRKLVKFRELKLDLSTYKAYIQDKEIELTLKEFNILKILIEIYPKVACREFLIENVWGYDFYGDTRVIDAHVKNIRKKIKHDYIKTLKGIGYVLTE